MAQIYLDAWIDELKNRGFAACRSHVDTRGIKTNATRNDAVEAANAVNDGRAGTTAKKANKAAKKPIEKPIVAPDVPAVSAGATAAQRTDEGKGCYFLVFVR